MLKTELLKVWYRLLPPSFELTPETTFRLSDDTFLEPDLVVYERATGLRALRGDNVLLVVEIADSSLRYDIGRKASLYAAFGVRELWVIDAVRLEMRVFRRPSPDGYAEIGDVTAAETATPSFAPGAFALRLDDLEIA